MEILSHPARAYSPQKLRSSSSSIFTTLRKVAKTHDAIKRVTTRAPAIKPPPEKDVDAPPEKPLPEPRPYEDLQTEWRHYAMFETSITRLVELY